MTKTIKVKIYSSWQTTIISNIVNPIFCYFRLWYNKIIMSSWRTSRDSQQLKKLYTQSNLKTNTSFELTQSIPVNDFHSPYRYANSIIQTNREEMPHSVIYIKDSELNNNSSFTLQPTITPEQINQFFIMVNMIKFYMPHHQEQLQLIRKKKYNLQRLQELVLEAEQRINRQRMSFQKHQADLQKRKQKIVSFKKKKYRAITQQAERIKYQIKDICKALHYKNGNRTQKQKSSLFIEARTEKKDIQVHKKRKRIYIPYQSQYIPHPNIFPTYFNPNPNYSQPFYPNNAQSPHPMHQSNTSQRNSMKNSNTQQIRLSKLKEALPIIRIDDPLAEAQNQQSNLDYFNQESNSKNSSQRKSRRKITDTNNNKQIGQSNSSLKWEKDDHEDKYLVQIISNSIKHLKTQKSQQHSIIEQYKANNIPLTYQEQSNNSRRNNRYSDTSQVNITYDSQQKRNNNNKSSDSNEDSNYRKKKSAKNSDKSDKVKLHIDQSNIKIEGVDMSLSKNSGNSKSDSSKHVQNRSIPSLNQPFHQIQQESQQVSLKTTPIQNKIRSSAIQSKNNSKNLKKSNKQVELSNNPKATPSPKIFPSPPNLFNKQQCQEQDQILGSIKLDTQSKISRNKNFDSQLFMKKEQDFDDILAGINLLRESKASRQKALSMRSSINRMQQVVYEQELQKNSQSQIFNKIENGQLTSEVDSSLRLSMTKKKNRNSYPDSREFMRKGFTQPVKRQLSSIPSAQIQEEQDESHSSKNSPNLGSSYR